MSAPMDLMMLEILVTGYWLATS